MTLNSKLRGQFNNFYRKKGVDKMYQFSKASLNKLEGVHQNLVNFMKELILIAPYDFKITRGVSTAEEQNKLYQQGRTTKGIKVTRADGYKQKSNHQIKSDGFGHAVDIFLTGVYENGSYRKFSEQEGYDVKRLKDVADHILAVAKSKNINVGWGGNWKKKDTPHFELK